MAGICCGVVGESEAAATVETTSRASRRRRLELRSFNIVADTAVQPPLESSRKRQKLDLDLFVPASSRDCDNAVQNSDANKIKKDHVYNEGLINSNGTVKLETEKSVEEEEKESPKFGMTSVCGRRRDMEDAVSMHPSFCKQSSEALISSDIHFFGVFDGHGCSHVRTKSLKMFHKYKSIGKLYHL